MPPTALTTPDFGKGLFRKMILKEVKMFENEVKKGKVAMAISFPIMLLLYYAVPIATLANPSGSNYILFGPYTYIMIYVMMLGLATAWPPPMGSKKFVNDL